MKKAKSKKPLFKKWWVWGIFVVLVVAVISGGSKDKEKPKEGTAFERSMPIESTMPGTEEPVSLRTLPDTETQKPETPPTEQPATLTPSAALTTVAPTTAPTPEPAPAPRQEATPAPTTAPAPEQSNITVAVHGAGRNVTLPSGTYVWIPATGSKFHNKNNCGNMNPDKAQMITVDEAQRRGYEACEKCY